MADEKKADNPPQYSAPQYPTAHAPAPFPQYGVQPQPGAVYVVPAQPPQSGVTAPPTGGAWRNGLCGCTKSTPWCVISCCLPGVLLVRMGDHLKNISDVKPILVVLAMCTLFSCLSSGMNSTARSEDTGGLIRIVLGALGAVVGLVALMFLIIYIFKMSKLRGDIRKRYMINGSDMGDLATVCCCTVCGCGLHNCQMFYEVADNEKMLLEWGRATSVSTEYRGSKPAQSALDIIIATLFNTFPLRFIVINLSTIFLPY